MRRRGQGLLHGRARAVEHRLQRLLPLVVAALAAVVLGLVGQAPHQDLPQPGHQLGLARADEPAEVAVAFRNVSWTRSEASSLTRSAWPISERATSRR